MQLRSRNQAYGVSFSHTYVLHWTLLFLNHFGPSGVEGKLSTCSVSSLNNYIEGDFDTFIEFRFARTSPNGVPHAALRRCPASFSSRWNFHSESFSSSSLRAHAFMRGSVGLLHAEAVCTARLGFSSGVLRRSHCVGSTTEVRMLHAPHSMRHIPDST